MNQHLLIVEDSRLFLKFLTHQFEGSLPLGVHCEMSYADAEKHLNLHGDQVRIALVDLNLPDCERGQIIDLMHQYNIPTIVLTATLSDEVRQCIWEKEIMDYVIKEGPHTLDYLRQVIENHLRNYGKKVLVVDDSTLSRQHVTRLLEVQRYKVLEAESGEQAIKMLREHSDIEVVITDYAADGVDGIELTRKIRESHPITKMAIIGISALGNQALTVQFLKNGANDFIDKPFAPELLYSRISQNTMLLEQFRQTRNTAIRDPLTNLHNRRHLFELGEWTIDNARRPGQHLALGLIDIDNFTAINEKHGHRAGDHVLKEVAEILTISFRKSDILTRYGGEEFCVITTNLDSIESAVEVFGRARQRIEMADFIYKGKRISVTASIGVYAGPLGTLNQMIRRADSLLDLAKESGRNQMCTSLDQAAVQ